MKTISNRFTKYQIRTYMKSLRKLYRELRRRDFPGGSVSKNPPKMWQTWGSIPGLGGSPGGGHSSPLQDPCLENPRGQTNLAGYSYSPWESVKHD